MADFISKDLQKQTVSPETYPDKIKLNKNEVSLQFLETKDNGGTFKLHYIVQIRPKGRQHDPRKKLSPADLDMESLRDAIVSNISAYDRSYLILKKFDDRKAFFEFNHKKWLKDAMKGIKPRTHFSKFDREFRFKKIPPKEIRKDKITLKFEQFLTRKFLDYLEDMPISKRGEFFKHIVPKKEQKKIKTKIRNMFDWSYDAQWNRMVAKLKTVYIIALLYATGAAAKKLKQININKSQKELFATKVEKNIKTFDKKKWEDFTKRKFF